MSKLCLKKSPIIWIGVLTFVVSTIGYILWDTSPQYVTEEVKIVANTDSGCIVEKDGFAINIGQCEGAPGDKITATFDSKVLERQQAMNPSM